MFYTLNNWMLQPSHLKPGQVKLVFNIQYLSKSQNI